MPKKKIIKEKLNRKELLNRLNHTNSKLKGVELLSSDESRENLLKTQNLLKTEKFTESEENYLKKI